MSWSDVWGKTRFVASLAIGAALIAAPIACAKQTKDATIKTWPKPKYPMLAGWLRLEGHCDVRFAVDEAGFPFAVMPSCTHRIFCFEAKRSVSDATFDPKQVDGIAQVRTDVVFPLEFAFEDSDYSVENDDRPLEPCEEKAVA